MPQEDQRPSLRAALPSVDGLLRRPSLKAAIFTYSRATVLELVKAALHTARTKIQTAQQPEASDRSKRASLIEKDVLSRLRGQAMPSLRRVFNLTGTVLHTNLGRAPLPLEAVDALREAASACNLEYDLGKGGRGERDSHVTAWLRRTSGAEAALVVNNNAAAVLLTLNSLAKRREVIVSRGELIEIGGSFRIPDVMKSAGCGLVEVGTTNRTHAFDYSDAICSSTAAIMRVHQSNFKIKGFTTSVEDGVLATIARQNNIPFIIDLGSGSLVDLSNFGLPSDPTVRQAIASGADIVTFSADKLVGGPQAGLLVGRDSLISKLRRNPMRRALRVDKLTIAALAATLRLYDDPVHLPERLPVLRLLLRKKTALWETGRRLLGPVQTQLGNAANVALETCNSQVGSGAVPVTLLPSWALAIRPTNRKSVGKLTLTLLSQAFRELPTPVVGRIHNGALNLDLRCLEDEESFLAQLSHLKLGQTS